MRILLGTNHLERLSGSEMVTLEFAEYFQQAGHEVTVFANWKALPMRIHFKKRDIPVETDPSAIRPMTYDLVYFQHHVAPLFDYTPSKDDRDRSVFAFGHLSPFGFWESGGWAHERALADLAFANSAETAEALAQAGVHRTHIFHNAAPDSFHVNRPELRVRPRRALFVSNHDDPAFLEAADILRGQMEVTHLGRSGEKVARVLYPAVRRAEIVVAIGKTVQYALAAGTPVYVYDRFGGPGYLSETNFEEAAHFNFAGRCSDRSLTGPDLAADILDGYGRARRFMLSMSEGRRERFRLSTHLDSLLQEAPSSNAARRERMVAQAASLARERLMAEFVRSAYVRERHQSGKIERLQQQMAQPL